ncbi:tetratricopeptide repeat protein [candidate division KSB1 bacterium]
MKKSNGKQADSAQLQREAEAAMRNGDTARAGKLLEQILDSGPPFAYGFYQLGLHKYNLGDKNTALEKLKEALRIAPDMISARFLLGKIYLEENESKLALEQFRSITKIDPDDHEAYFLMAKGCLHLNMTEEARALLHEAYDAEPDEPKYSEALGALYYQQENFSEAYRFFTGKALRDTDRTETLNLLGECAGKIGDTSAQINAFERSLALKPDQPDLESKLAEARERSGIKIRDSAPRKKISIFSNIDSFLGDITEHLKLRYQVKRFAVGGLDDLAGLMQWSDLSWFEWCDNLLVQASRLPKQSVILCRMHKYEVFTDMPDKVNWENVDHLICVFKLVADVLKKRIDIKTPVSIIPNGVNFNKYPFPENKRYGKKIAYVGHIKKSKGPELLLQCFAKIYRYDPEYTFHIAGFHQDQEFQIYFDHLIARLGLPVKYYGWIENIEPWLSDKDYILSSSVSEAFQYAVVEGIAKGLLPLVHNWPDSDTIYPGEVLFSTVDECLELLQKYEKSSRPELARSYRERMEERFSLEKQLKSIDAIIDRYL